MSDLPYLQGYRTSLRELLYRARMLVTYHVWKRAIDRHLEGPTQGITIADVGSGSGYLLASMGNWFPSARLIGVDVIPEYLHRAQRTIPRGDFRLGNADKLPIADGEVDVLFCIQVLEHLEHPERFFAEARRVIRNGGLLLIATPNTEGLAAKLLGDKWIGIRYDHIALAAPVIWQRRLREHGFEIVDDGSTTLSGFPMMQRIPFSLVNWAPLVLFGFLPWYLGESYMAISIRREGGDNREGRRESPRRDGT